MTTASRPLRKAVAKTKVARAQTHWDHAKLATNARQIPIEAIIADPDQPRKDFDDEELERLSGSLKSSGQLQPILVRWSEDADRWIIVVGERRFRAALKAGLESLLAVVATDDQVARLREVQFVENCCRSELNPVEQAEAFRSLIDEKGWSQSRLAEELGINQSSVSRSLALLELPGDLRSRVVAGDLSPAVAKVLSGMKDPKLRRELTLDAIKSRWSASQASGAVRGRGGDLVEDEESGVPETHSLGYAQCITEGAGETETNSLGYARSITEGIRGEAMGVEPATRHAGIAPAIGEGRDVPKKVPLTGTITVKPIKPQGRVEPNPPRVYFYLDDESGLEITVESPDPFTNQQLLEALWRLRNKVEREFLKESSPS